jgi:putative signal transducing protein
MAGDAHGEHVQVAETGQAYEAELIALRLRSSGIDAHVIDQTFHAEPLPNVRSFAVVRVLVPAAQADEARRVLAAGTALPEDVDPEGGTPEVM